MTVRVVQDSLSRRGRAWRLSYHIVGEDGAKGTRKFVSLGACKSAREARQRANDKLSEVKASCETSGAGASAGEPTLLEAYMAHVDGLLATKAIEPRTHSNYSQRAKRLGWLGEMAVTEIGGDHVRRYMTELLEGGYCANSVATQLGAIRQTLSRCEREGLVASNPCADVKAPRRTETKPRALQAQERERLVAALPSMHGFLPVAITLSLGLGLRRGEACGLTWGAVDFEGGRVLVRQAVGGQGGGWYVKAPKTARSCRTLPMGPDVRAALLARREEQAARCLDGGVDFTDALFVLGDVDGGFLSPNALSDRFSKLTAALGIADGECKFHWLRHTFATGLISGGVDVRTVAAWLGHTDPGFTLRTYVDLDERALRGSVDVVSRNFEVPEGAGPFGAGPKDAVAKAGPSNVIPWDEVRRMACIGERRPRPSGCRP